MGNKIELILEVDDKKGVRVVKQFSSGVENKVKDMATKSSKHITKMERTFEKLGGTVRSVTNKIGGITTKIVALGAAAVTAFAGFTLKKSLEEFAKFETALVDVAKVSKEPLESVKRKIMDMDPALGSATQMIKGYYQTMSAGVTEPKAALETLTQGAQMAKAAHIEQGTAIEALTKLMAGYQGKIKNVSDAADLLFTIEKEGVTTVAQLSTEIGGLAAMSNELSISQNELGGALALITQTAGSTSEAATQYQAVISGLMKPTEEMKTALHEMGYESAQAAIENEGLAGVLENLKEYTGGSAEKMNELFGRVEAVKGVAALSANNFETLTDKVEAMKNKTGAAAGAWEKYKGTLSAIWTTFKNTVGKQLIMIGELLAPYIKNVVDNLGKWLEANRELLKQEIGDWIRNVAGFAKELWPFVRDIATKVGEWYQRNDDMLKLKFNEYLDKVKTAVGQLKENIDLIKVPFELFYKTMENLAGKSALIASDIATLHDKLDKIKKIFEEQGWKKAIEELIGPLKNLNDGLKNFKDRLLELSNPLILITKFFQESGKLVNFFVTKLKAAKEGLEGLVQFIEYLRNPVKFVVDFLGKGSSELPLTEKMTEIEEKFQLLMTNIEAMKPKFEVDFESVSEKIAGIETQLQNLEEVKPKIELDIDPALSQLQTLNSVMQSTYKSLAQMEAERAAVLGAMESVNHYRYSEVKRWWDSQISEQKRLESQINKDLAIQQKYSAKYSDYSTKAGSGGRKYWYEYQHGTGPSGLPYTGVFYGHKGEIVKSPSESRRERAGLNKTVKIESLNINIPASAAPQRPEDWRYITREYIKPELEKIT